MIYSLIAPIYDEVNKDINYSEWADFFEQIFERELVTRPELVLDLGCGTGKMTLEIAKRGYDMTGVDSSPEMLDIARESAEILKKEQDVLWLCQDMRNFELYGTVDVVVSCLDCINHLTSAKDLRKCFSLVHNYLIPDGLFIFDVNGKRKFEEIYSDNSYVIETEDKFCVWQNFYNPKSKLCDFYITLFCEEKNDKYVRYDEADKERMYTINSLKRALSECDMEFVGAYSDFSFASATDNDERIYIVSRCKK